jgi:hypothetical protein
MATEKLHVVVGEWYWGARCPECGEMAAHSQGDGDKPGEAQVTMTCAKWSSLLRADRELAALRVGRPIARIRGRQAGA